MQSCYQHPKLEAVAHCRRCKLPVCCHCRDGEYCPDCTKLNRYFELGYSGRQQPKLIEPVVMKSRTKELMIQRLQAQAYDADAASIRDAKAGKRPSPRRKPIKTRQDVSYGPLLPGLSPLIRVTRSPWSLAAAIAVTAFGLGSFFTHPRTTYAEPNRPATAAPAEPTVEMAPVQVGHSAEPPVGLRMPPAIGLHPAAWERTFVAYRQTAVPLQPTKAVRPLLPHYAPAFATAAGPTPAQLAQKAPTASVSPHVMAAAWRAVVRRHTVVTEPLKTWDAPPATPEAVATPVAARVPAPKVEIAFPSPGGTIRSTSYVQVRIDKPAHLKEVFLMVDGHPAPATLVARSALEVPLDTTNFRNGDHFLKVIAHQEDGQVVSSDEVPVAIVN